MVPYEKLRGYPFRKKPPELPEDMRAAAGVVWSKRAEVERGEAYVGRGKGRGSLRLGGRRGTGSHSTQNCIIFHKKVQNPTRANAFAEKI